MQKNEALSDFKEEQFLETAAHGAGGEGRFKVFRFEDYLDCDNDQLPYRRRDYYKITLARAKNKLYYADRAYETIKQSLLFTNPFIPYHREQVDKDQTGYFCVFTKEFFHYFGNLSDYDFFNPDGIPIYELTDAQYGKIEAIFQEMEREVGSAYIYKNDLIRNLVYQVLHGTAKMYPAARIQDKQYTASGRLSALFLDLLERQFPVDHRHESIKLRTASGFAANLSVSVNHLNKVLKERQHKSTSALINARILMEAKQLLRKTNWNISEIAYCLAFKEATHFNNFFKKQSSLTPTQYRES